MKDVRLKRQLRLQASTRKEADDLAALARSLRQAPVPHLGRDAKDDIAERLGLHPKRYRIEWRLSLAAGFAAVAVFVVMVQTAAPGSSLHDVRSALTKLMPWSQPPQPPSLAPNPGNQPLQPLLAPPATDDTGSRAPSMQDDASTPRPELSPLQVGDTADTNHEVLLDLLETIPLQPPLN